MAKAETQGLNSLTVVERERLKALFARLEELPTTPLNNIPGAKDRLRRDASSYFYERLHPELSSVLRDPHGVLYDVHHCIPLQHAHLFPLRDINAASNLAATARSVHVKINNVWTRAQATQRELTAGQVEETERIVRKHFGRWFNKAYDGSDKASKELAAAESAALEELRALLGSAH